MPTNSPYKLKGIIPPKDTDPQAFFEALQELREFLRQFPGLGEEVMRDREQRRQEEDRALAERNQFYFGSHV